MKTSFSQKWWIVVFLMIVIAALAPLWISGYAMRYFTFVFMWIGLAGSLNLLTGYTGYLDFGHVAFFGIGAYTTGILMLKFGMYFIPSMAVGAFAAGFIALILGIPTLRLRGAYFAIAMLAFAEAMKHVVLELDEITGGGNGLSLPIYTKYEFFYYMMLFAVLLTIAMTWWFGKSKFGYALKAIREDELAADVSGVNTFSCKLIAFGISAFVAGLIGGIYAYWMTFITPDDSFHVLITVRMIIMAFLGGAGTVLGPIIGASFLASVEEVLWANFGYTYLIIVGLIIVVVVLYIPRGIVGLVRDKIFSRYREREQS